jgi:hypothetical protein
MYIQYFNKKKLQVPKVQWVSYITMQMTGSDGYYPLQVSVLAGMGGVWQNPTHGIPVQNPKLP